MLLCSASILTHSTLGPNKQKKKVWNVYDIFCHFKLNLYIQNGYRWHKNLQCCWSKSLSQNVFHPILVDVAYLYTYYVVFCDCWKECITTTMMRVVVAHKIHFIFCRRQSEKIFSFFFIRKKSKQRKTFVWRVFMTLSLSIQQLYFSIATSLMLLTINNNISIFIYIYSSWNHLLIWQQQQ